MAVQMEAVQKVKEIIDIFRKLAGQTSSSVNDIDGLIAEMYEIDHSIVYAAQRILDVSQKTEELSVEVTGSLEEELKDIQSGVSSLTEISGYMEQEMRKFKVNSQINA